MELSTNKKRIFIAVNISDKIKKNICNGFDLVNEYNLKPVSWQNMHITLKFIGYVDNKIIDKIKEVIKNTLKNIDPYYYQISNNIDFFPIITNAKVIVLKIKSGSSNFVKIFKRLEKELSLLNIAPDPREYIPHITLARMKNPCSAADLVNKIKIKSLEKTLCSKLTLFESVLKKNGPEYIIIDEFNLKKLK